MAAWGSGFAAPWALALYIGIFAALGLLVLWYDSAEHGAWRERARGWVHRLSGASELSWIDARLLTAIAAGAFAAGAIANAALGAYACSAPGPSDLTTLFTSGQEFLRGGSPFTITACGVSGNPVPAGMASVLLDALGSLGGEVGVLLIWGAVSVALIPLVWSLAGARRTGTTLWVLVSFLYLPVVAVQVDGASLAIVPLAILLMLYLARRGWVLAAGVGGFLATGRFPALFPVLAATGRAGARRTAAFAGALGVFAAVTLVTIAIFGSDFTGPVFFAQFSRGNFSLEYWGVLQGEGWLNPSTALTVVQALLIIVLVGVTWLWARSTLGAIAILLIGTVLLTQYLSFTALIFLLPVALLGCRARWWLWAIGLVAISNYLLAIQSYASVGGSAVPSYVLDLVLTGLLLGLLIELFRTELLRRPAPGRSSDPSTLSEESVAADASARPPQRTEPRSSAPRVAAPLEVPPG
ncbi:MAG: hypothetical protein WAN74_02580 [Thermoplasmata archaeon]